MACSTVETAIYLFAIINLASTSVCILFAVLMFVLVVTDTFSFFTRRNTLDAPTAVLFLLYLGILTVTQVFSVCLLQGIRKKDPKFLKSFIIFGISLLIVMPLMLVYTYFCFYEWREQPDSHKHDAIIAMVEGYLIAALIYCPVLYFVHRIYKKNKCRRGPIGFKPLVLYRPTTETT